MRKPQDDLRYQKTEGLIQRAFRELMGEMDYGRITIQKLADRAQINRKTFYLHYSSVDELLLKMQKQIVEEFLEPIKDAKLPGDLEKVVRNCYEASEKADAMNEKILCSRGRFPVENQQPDGQEFDMFDPADCRYAPWERPYLTAPCEYVAGSHLPPLGRNWAQRADGRYDTADNPAAVQGPFTVSARLDAVGLEHPL